MGWDRDSQTFTVGVQQNRGGGRVEEGGGDNGGGGAHTHGC